MIIYKKSLPKTISILRTLRHYRRKFLVALLIILIAVTSLRLYTFLNPQQTEAAWWNDRWAYRKELIIDNTKVSGSTDFTDFPVLVNRTDTDLKDKAQTNGYDIVFVDENMNTLEYEIESYDNSTGELVAWVKVPTIYASQDTILYMYYGNPSITTNPSTKSVWDNNYKMIWHMNDASGHTQDSTANEVNSTSEYGLTYSATGKVGDAISFASGYQASYIRRTAHEAVEQYPYTWEFWYKGTLDSGNTFMWANDLGWRLSDGTSYLYEWKDENGDDFDPTSVSGTGGESHSSTTWYYGVLVLYDTGDNRVKFYRNGSLLFEGGGTAKPALIGSIDWTTWEWNYPSSKAVTLDEIRISAGTRSADWISTNYEAMNSPSTFFKSGGSETEETGPSPSLYLKFDEGVDNTCSGGTNDTCDETSNENDGAISNGTAWQTEDLCLIGKCLFFDGSDDIVTVTNADSIDMDKQLVSELTYQTWIRVNTDGEASVGEIFDKGASTYLRTTNEGTDGYADLEASLDLNDATGSNATKTITNGITLDKWHHVAMTYTDDADDEITVYIDGQSQGSSTNGSGAPQSDANNLLIGGGSGANFHGFIDEFKIYKEERDSEEIKTDYLKTSSLHGAQAGFGIKDYSYLSNGLVGYWNLNETSGNVSDLSGHSTTLTNNNTVAFTAAKFGNGGEFNGTTQYFDAIDNTYLSVTDDLTLAAWINPDDVTGTEAIVAKFDDSDESYLLAQVGDEIRMYIDSSSNYETTDAANLSANSLYHVAGVYDSEAQTVKLFVNGKLKASTTTGTIPSSIGDDVGEFSIGAEDTGGTPANYFDGHIDDVRVYNRTFTPNEINNLYTWAPAPVGYWNFNEGTGITTVYDQSTKANNGTINNMAEDDWVPGKFGHALDFDGSNDNISRTDDPDFDFAASDNFTVEAWVKHDGTISLNNDYILTKADTINGGYKLYMDSSGDFCFVTDDDTSWDTSDSACTSAVDYDDDNWHHVVGVKTNTTQIELFVDGISVASDVSLDDTGTLANSNTLYIAVDRDGTSNEWDGPIDEVKIYNYARTVDQIIKDMNAGHPAPGSPVGSPVGYWRLDEGYGTTAHDNSVKGNDLTLSSASWTNSGKFDKAWNGTGALWLSRTDDDDFDFTASQDFSISLWLKSDSASNPGSNEYLIDKEAGTGYAIYANTSGYLLFGIDSDGTWTPADTASSGVDIYDGTWHHLVAVKTGTTKIELYVDGTSRGSDESLSATGSLANADSLTLGSQNTINDTDDFNGDLDEVKIFRSALSSSQVKAELNQGSAQVMGALSTDSSGNADWSSKREYCPPGNTETNCASSQDPTPIAHWKFDENTGTSSVYDSSTNEHTLTMNGSMTEADWVPGKFGSALDFDGSNDILTENDHADYNPNTFTQEAWVKFDVLPSDSETAYVIEKKHSVSPWASFYIYIDAGDHINGKIWNQAGTGSGNYSQTQVVANTWYHIANVWDNSNVYLYINGHLEDIDALSGTSVFDADGTLRVGADYAGTPGRTDGQIDDIRIYPYARTASQVALDYNHGKPVGHWKFDECQGTTIHDSSVNGNNETNGNDGTWSGSGGTNTSAGTCTGSSGEAWYGGVTGKRNYSLDFDGTDDYISVPDTIQHSFDVSTTAVNQDGQMSVSAWVYMDDATDFNIVSKGSSSAPEYLFETDSLDKLKFWLYDSVSTVYIGQTSSSALTSYQGSWVHVAATYDASAAASGITLYVNGQEVLSSSNTGGSYVAMDNESGGLTIGRNFTDGSDYANGKIDDIRLYRYELTSQQVMMITNDGTASFQPLTGSP